jgi:hypothetical protein
MVNHTADNATRLDDPPVPAGASTDGWCSFTGVPGDVIRFVTWSTRRVGATSVAVDGMQYRDGDVQPQITIYGDDSAVTAADARALAAALIEAADELDRLR